MSDFDSTDLDCVLDTSTVDTSFPSLAVGQVDCQITETSAVTANSGMPQLCLTLSTIRTNRNTKGEVINPGFKLYKRLNLRQPDSAAALDFKIGIARLQEAALGAKSAMTVRQLVAELLGKGISVNIKKRTKDTDQYGETEVGDNFKPIATE